MTIRCNILAAALVALPMAALAQPAAQRDPNCKWDTLALAKSLPGGRATILDVKNPGNKDCTGGDCNNYVEVQSFNRAVGGAEACCTRVEWGSLTASKGNPNVDFRWEIVSVDGKSYVFNPFGIAIVQPPLATPDELGTLKLSSGDREARIKSVNKNKVPKTFNYDVSVSRKERDGSYLACDPNDPVIVNQGD